MVIAIAEQTEECVVTHTINAEGTSANKNLFDAQRLAAKWPIGEFSECGLTIVVPESLKHHCHPDKSITDLEKQET